MSRKLINQIKEKELYRRMNKHKNNAKKEISQFIQREFMLNVSLSKNYSIVDTASGFIDLRKDHENAIHRIIISKTQGGLKFQRIILLKKLIKFLKTIYLVILRGLLQILTILMPMYILRIYQIKLIFLS